MAARDASAPSIADPRGGSRGGRALAAWLPAGLSVRLEQLFEAERDQLPLWLPVGLILGISAWFWLPDQAGWIAFLFLALALALAPGRLRRRDARWGRALVWFMLAAALGCGLIWWKAERVAAPRLERERVVEFSGRIDSVQPLAAEQTVRLVVAPVEAGLPARLRVNVDEDEAAGLVPGATVRIKGWLMPPAPMAAPGGYDFARAAWFQRIGGSGRAADIAILAPPSRAELARAPRRLAPAARRPYPRAARRQRRGRDRGRAGHRRPGRHSRGRRRGDAPLGPRPSALGQRPPPHRRGRRGDAADAEAARA